MIYPVINPTIIFYFLIVLFLILILLGLNLLLSPMNPDSEKASSFECGFTPIQGQVRNPFFINFYLVAILFLVFDLEVFFLFPFSIVLNKISFYGFSIFLIFFIILTIGLVYELGHEVIDFTKNYNNKSTSK